MEVKVIVSELFEIAKRSMKFVCTIGNNGVGFSMDKNEFNGVLSLQLACNPAAEVQRNE